MGGRGGTDTTENIEPAFHRPQLMASQFFFLPQNTDITFFFSLLFSRKARVCVVVVVVDDDYFGFFFSSLTGGAHGHLQQDDLPVLRRVALVYVPGEARRAVQRGGAVLARVDLGGVHEAQVSLLAGPAGEALPAHRAQQAVHRAQVQRALV